MSLIADLAYLAAGAAMAPVLLYRAVRHGRYRAGWSQRFGHVERKDVDRPCIWVHAVSLGEVNACKSLVAELQRRRPDHEIVVSATTDTGFARAQELLGSRLTVFYFPLDLSWIVRRAFDQLRPSVCLLMELEVWPNFVETARWRDVPVVVVNGRISDRSFRSYCRARMLLAGTFRRISLILAQNELYAERFRHLGCPSDRVSVTGSLKFDTAQVADTVEGADTLAARLGLGSAPLWVAGGTGDDEERPLLEVYRQLKTHPGLTDLRLAIVPRKPERFDQVAHWIEQAGLPLVRYSRVKDRAERGSADPAAVILGDTMGDLRKFYSLATVIFVGRSLVPMGGSDMMEAAALGRPTLFGPHTFNFQQAVDLLLGARGALQVADADALREGLQRCLLEPDTARTLAENGRQVIRDNQGATGRTVDRILEVMASGVPAY